MWKTALFTLWIAASAAGNEAITVKIYNLAGLKSARITAALTEAHLVLGKAGFDTKWLHCLPNAAVETGPCAQSDLSTFSIGIRKDDPRENVTHFTLGFAMLNTARANTACAIYSRITELVEQNPGAASVEIVLGYVIAHELAHLIQRTNIHSTGVMSEGWTVGQLRAMSQRRLRFTTSQTRDLWKAMEARQN